MNLSGIEVRSVLYNDLAEMRAFDACCRRDSRENQHVDCLDEDFGLIVGRSKSELWYY